MTEAGTERADRPTVPRSLRIGSFLLSVVLMFLFIWLLGFMLADIGDLEGPDWNAILAEHEDPEARARVEELEADIAELEWRVSRQEELQGDLKRSMDNARGTMQQMMDLQRLALEQGVAVSEIEKEALAQSQQRFLDAQDRFESANAEIASSNETRYRLQQEKHQVQIQLDGQREPALEDWNERERAHRFQVASWKLVVIVPLFLLSAWAFHRKRASAYRSILMAALAATFWKVGRVMHEHFPLEFFKYIAIVAAIAIVLAFLVWLLRKAAKPGRDLLLTRYREAYRAHVCPVCAHPMARGPLRYAVWTRKGPRAAAPGGEPAADVADDQPYGCPSCGTSLFAACGSCGSLRHTLLPYCEHCGDERADGPLAAAG
jgi:predicted RNA-binding Zn-ribbon protein involved in translation (DUF1610 family)